MKKFIVFLSFIALIMSNNLTAQDARNDIDPNASTVVGNGNSTEAIYDLLRYHNVDSLITSAAGYGVVWTGNYYIISIFNLNAFYKVSADWSLIAGPIAIAGSTLPAANGFRDMEFANGYLWGVAAAAASNRIYKVDTATFTQQAVINLPSGVIPRDLAWDPVRRGFWTSTNSFSGNLQCYDTNGVAIAGAVIPTVVGGFYGVAYDGNTAGGPYLWLAKDPSPAGPSITALVRFNIAAAPVRLDSAVITIPGTVGAPNLASGGLDFRTNLVPGKTTLIGLVQGTPDKVCIYEVGSTGPPVCSYSWTTQTSGTTALMQTVSAVNNQIGWAGGAAGTVRRTTDGGITWGNGNPNPGVISGDIYNIYAWSANDALCTTSPSATNIYKTTNGGTNWTQVYTLAGGFIDGLQMVSATEGYGLGDPVGGKWVVVKTTDGGNTWARMATEPTQVGTEAGWNNAFQIVGTNMWFGTNSTKVYHSTDLGLTWTGTATTGTLNTYALQFNSVTNGMAGGTAMVKSTDGGTTYTAATSPGTSGNINGMDGKDNDWWSIRTGTDIYRTTNQGTTWTSAYTVAGAAFNDIDLADGLGGCPTGWAVGTGTIVKMSTTTGISSYAGEVPTTYLLNQNYPNPFNPTTNINFSIPKTGFVTLKIYNTVGMEVATLVNETKTAGNYIVGFNASNLPSGAYFYRIETGNYTDTKKMLLLK